MTKKLNETAIVNELKGHSRFFQKPPTNPASTTDTEPAPPQSPIPRSEERTVFRSDLPTKRRTKRYSFEFYEDQLLKLKQLKYRAEMSGERIFLSDLVRDALDQYLKTK